MAADATGLLARLAAADSAGPVQDRPAGEAAFARHLVALGAEPCPVLWCATPEEAIRRARRHASGYRRRWRQGIRRHVPWWLRPLVWLGEHRPNVPHSTYYDLQGAAEAAQDAALREAARTGPHAEAALRSALEVAAADLLYDAAHAAVHGTRWSQTLSAAGVLAAGGLSVAERAAWAVVEENTRLVLDHPAQARYAELWLPMVDAYIAGARAYWIGPDELLVLDAPALLGCERA